MKEPLIDFREKTIFDPLLQKKNYGSAYVAAISKIAIIKPTTTVIRNYCHTSDLRQQLFIIATIDLQQRLFITDTVGGSMVAVPVPLS